MYEVVKMHSFRTKSQADQFAGSLDPSIEVLLPPTKTAVATFVPSIGNRRTDEQSPVWVVVVAL